MRNINKNREGKKRAEIGFVSSKTAILTWVTRSVNIGPGKLGTINCRLLWTRTIPNRKNACRAIGCQPAKKGRIINKDMTSWFSSTTTHHRACQKCSETTWKHSTERCYSMPFIHQTWPPSDYHLFSSMGHALAEQHFDSHKFPERWEKCVASKGKYFE